jgi:hypothetical protein
MSFIMELERQASEYFAALHGPDSDNARHRLVELGRKIIPLVATRLQNERDFDMRATLVNIAWQAHPEGALPLLRDALDDPEPRVWKEALDGLVTAGGAVALEVLRKARIRADADKSQWLDEAIEQICGGDLRRQNPSVRSR